MERLLARTAVPLLALLLSACGGGGGGGAATPPTLSITSPSSGARITGGASAVTVTGTVTAGATVKVAVNGGAAVDATVTGTAFSATVPLGPKDNSLVATATNSAGMATATVDVYYPYLALTTFQSASVVIGQADFTSTAGSLFVKDGLWGNPAWDGSQLYLPDYNNNKVQVFSGVPTASGASPSFTMMTANGGTLSESTLDSPQTVLAAGGKLLLVAYGQNRVLVFDALPTADGAAASVAVGQPDVMSYMGACSATGLHSPESAFVVGTKLIVADSGNNRVLVWNTIPTRSGQAADLVLGQTNFDACSMNAGAGVEVVSGSGFNYPTDVWSDGARLFVVDQTNHRILGWNTFPTANGQAADFVLGQADFTTRLWDTTHGGLNTPYFVGSNGNQLFVADANNRRVLIWNALPSATGALPDVVLGQKDFTHGAAWDADQDGISNSTPSANTFANPRGLLVLDDALVVSDAGAPRYVVFR